MGLIEQTLVSKQRQSVQPCLHHLLMLDRTSLSVERGWWSNMDRIIINQIDMIIIYLCHTQKHTGLISIQY